MVRRTKENAEVTRTQLLDAAEVVFNEKGVARASLAEIASAAGVTRGAIYWHFKDKADLVHAMLDRVKLPIDEMVDKLSANQLDDPLNYLRSTAISVLRLVAQDAQTCRVFDIVNHKCELVADMEIGRERELQRRGECICSIETAISTAREQGLVSAIINPQITAFAWYAYVSGLISCWVLNPGLFSLADEAPSMVDMLLDGLRKRDE
jgi:TetR/AcrR family acrAB operon transcriptional repressor